MVTSRDFQGVDAGWLAVDAIGQVALFTTGGEGPMPDTALASVETAEEWVLSLPEVSGCDLLVTVPRPDDFVAFARRGFFAYDWSDVHRTTQRALGGYELQSRPTCPLCLSDLPGRVQALAAATQISGVTFGVSIVVLDGQVGT